MDFSLSAQLYLKAQLCFLMSLCYKNIKPIFKQLIMLNSKVFSKRPFFIVLSIAAIAMWRRVCIFMRGDFAMLFHPMTH